MRYVLKGQEYQTLSPSSNREWLLTNGIGGYAMGTISGINTRRYHGYLIAATQPPIGRTVLLASVDAFIEEASGQLGLSANRYPGAVFPEGYQYIEEFSVSNVARWIQRAEGLAVEKKICLHPGENACTVTYQNIGDRPFLLSLRPLVCHKPHHENFYESAEYPQSISFPKDSTTIKHRGIFLVLKHPNAQRIPSQGWYYRFEHDRELERGLDPRDDLYCPCELKYELRPGEKAVLMASTDEKTQPLDIESIEDTDEVGEASAVEQLKQAARSFFVQTETRSSIIAGYPWFTDWGRDTMISLPGICLHTGKTAEARKILSDYATQLCQGLIPNRFVEVGEKPDYNTVDATLWFANAIYATLQAEWHDEFAEQCMKHLEEVYYWHDRGTFFGIGVDQEDGLLRQGQPNVQLTWMDAKVGDWVVTPRHGKPVEINGLWVNALRVMEWLANKLHESKQTEELKEQAEKYKIAAEKAEASFDEKFWHNGVGHYVDTVDPIDVSMRPNQVIAMSLPFAPAKGEKAVKALQAVSRELLTPYGLRTLGPQEPHYKGRYKGALPDLDAAYHQGTVWPWLLGPYVSALMKLTNDKEEARRILFKAYDMLFEYGIGGIAETYDGDPPQLPGGCPWQAWSIAEILRVWVEELGGDANHQDLG